MAIVIAMALKITDGKLFLERHVALLKTNHIFDTVRRQLRGRLNFISGAPARVDFSVASRESRLDSSR